MAVRFIYDTSGRYVAFITDGHLFNPGGDWLGFIANGNEVYQHDGTFAGYVTGDDRVVRNRAEHYRSRVSPPPRPLRPLRPLTPLRRMRMPPVPYPYEDVFLG